MNRSKRAITIAAVATLALLALDLGTKVWAVENLSVEHPGNPPEVCEEPGRNQRLRSESVVLVDGLMELSYAENCGAAFGLLNDSPSWIRRTVFGIAAIAAAVFLSLFFVRGKGGPLFAWSVPLVVSGAVGNFADRARLGYVVDFIRVHYDEPFDFLWWHLERFEYPTFNVADITITIGVVLLILDGIFEERRIKREKAEAQKAKEEEEEKAKSGSKRKKTKKSKGARSKARKKQAEADDKAADDSDPADDEADAADDEADAADEEEDA